MEDLENAPTAHVKDYMRRFCNQLGLKHTDVVVAEEFALAACPRDGVYASHLPWLCAALLEAEGSLDGPSQLAAP